MSKLDDKPTGMELIIYKRSKHRLIKQDFDTMSMHVSMSYHFSSVLSASVVSSAQEASKSEALEIFPVVPFLRELPGFVRSVGDRSLFGRLEIASVEAIADAAA